MSKTGSCAPLAKRIKKSSDVIKLLDETVEVKKQILGEGGFGVVHLGRLLPTDELVAVKMQPKSENSGSFKREIVPFKLFQSIVKCPKLITNYSDESHHYIVMELLGESLLNLLDSVKFKPTLKVILEVSLQILNRIEEIHRCGFIHGDLKPENFLFGKNGQESVLYVCDFGHCASYLKEDGSHIEKTRKDFLEGTVGYMSFNAHRGNELGRQDDLESFFFMVLEMYQGSLPWSNLEEYETVFAEKLDSIGSWIKRKSHTGQNMAKELDELFTEIRQLTFKEEPKYENYRNILREAARNHWIQLDEE